MVNAETHTTLGTGGALWHVDSSSVASDRPGRQTRGGGAVARFWGAENPRISPIYQYHNTTS
jgi:hypothetical protein